MSPDPELVAVLQERADELRLELLKNGHVRLPIEGAGGAHVLIVLTPRGELLVSIHGPGDEGDLTPPT